MVPLESVREGCSNRHILSPGEFVKALRHALDLTQEQVAERSGGKINQGTLAKIEGGQNKLTGTKAKEGLALAFGVSLDDFTAYVGGKLPRGELVARRRGETTRHPSRELTLEREEQHVPEDRETPVETALLRQMDPKLYTMRDLDAARSALQGSGRRTEANTDLDSLARDVLRAAKHLRLAGEPTDPSSVLRLALLGRHTRAAETADAIRADEDEESAQRLRALGHEPNQGRAAVDARLDELREKRGRRG